MSKRAFLFSRKVSQLISGSGRISKCSWMEIPLYMSIVFIEPLILSIDVHDSPVSIVHRWRLSAQPCQVDTIFTFAIPQADMSTLRFGDNWPTVAWRRLSTHPHYTRLKGTPTVTPRVALCDTYALRFVCLGGGGKIKSETKILGPAFHEVRTVCVSKYPA